jgi:hypothetical protein
MANFIDTITQNPELTTNVKQALGRYLIPALVATLGTGGAAAYIAGSKKRVGESPAARRRRIIRATLLPTLTAALGSAGLIGSSIIGKTSPESYVATGKLLGKGQDITEEKVESLVKSLSTPSLSDKIFNWGNFFKGTGTTLGGMLGLKAKDKLEDALVKNFKYEYPSESGIKSLENVPKISISKSPATEKIVNSILGRAGKTLNSAVKRAPSLAALGIGGAAGYKAVDWVSDLFGD